MYRTLDKFQALMEMLYNYILTKSPRRMAELPTHEANTLPFQAQAPTSRAGHIKRQILDAVLSGTLAPEEFIGTESSLAETFDTSRLPVREALKQLSAIGAVTVTTGVTGGARAARPDPERVTDVLAIQFALLGVSTEEVLSTRLAIEPLAVRLAAEQATDEEIRRLKRLLERAAELAEGPATDYPKTAAAMLDIHSALVEASHNRALSVMTRGLIRVLLHTYHQFGSQKMAKEQGLARLKKLVERLEERDADGAEQHSRTHLRGQMKRWLALEKQRRAS